MEMPRSLPARMYLLAYDPARQRLTARSQLGYIIRAAALMDLLLDGHLVDESGKAAVTGPRPVDDPVLELVRQQIVDSRPRSWTSWVARGHGQITATIREQLHAGRWIRLEQRRVLGVFPLTSVTVRDTRMRKRFAARLTTELRRGSVAQMDLRDAATIALAAAGDLRTVLSRSQAREYTQRIAQLTDRVGPVAPALRTVLEQKKAVEAAAG